MTTKISFTKSLSFKIILLLIFCVFVFFQNLLWLDKYIFPAKYFDFINLLVALISVLVPSGIFFIGWYSFRRSQKQYTILWSSAALSIAIFNLFSLTDVNFSILGKEVNAPYFYLSYLIQGYLLIIIFLLSLTKIYEKTKKITIKYSYLLISVSLALILSYVMASISEDVFIFLNENDNKTKFYVLNIVISVVLLGIAFMLLWEIKKTYYTKYYSLIICSLITLVFDRAIFFMHNLGGTSYNSLSFFYNIATYYFLFTASIYDYIEAPYNELLKAKEEVTEANKEISSSRAKYLKLLNNAKDIIFKINLKTRKPEYFNISFYNILGYEPYEVVEPITKVRKIIHPDSLILFDELDHAINNNDAKAIEGTKEFKLVHKNGNIVFTELNATVEVDENGELLFIEGILRDITDRKLLENRMSIYYDLFINSYEGIFLLDEIGHIIDINSTIIKQTGFERRFLIGKPISSTGFTFPDDSNNFIEFVSKTDGLWRGEQKIKRKDGSHYFTMMFLFSSEGHLYKKQYMLLSVDISEQKILKKKLSETEVKYKEIFDNVSSSIIVIDKDGKIIDINKYFLTEFCEGKFEKDSFIGHFVKDHFIFEGTSILSNINELIRGLSFSKYDVHFPKTKHFPSQWANISGVPIFNEISEFSYGLIILQSTTERKLVEEEKYIIQSILLEETKEAVEKYQNLLSNIPEIVYSMTVCKSQAPVINFISNKIETLTGYSPEDFYKNPYLYRTLVSEDDLKQIENLDYFLSKDVEQANREIEYEIQNVKTNENFHIINRFSYRYIENKLENQPQKNDPKVLIEGIIFDVTEMRTAKRKIENLEAFTQEIIKQSPIGIFSINNSGQIININPAMQGIFHSQKYYSPDNFLETPFIKDKAIDFLYDRAFKDGESFIIEDNFTFEKTKHLYWLSEPIQSDNEIATIVSFVVDLTAQYELQQEKEKLQKQLVQNTKLAALGELSASIAHEINNPLFGIINLSEILIDDLENHSQQHEFMKNILTEAKRISTIIRNLLSYSRKDSQEFDVLSVREILSSALSLVNKSLMKSNIKVINEISDDNLSFKAKKQQMEQVFINLFFNSKYALEVKEGSYKKFIKISAEIIELDGKSNIEIRFSDNGIGIAEKDKAKIFEPFYTTKKSGEGTGLGLSICYKIIKEHNGIISVESKPSEGTTFIITIPQTD